MVVSGYGLVFKAFEKIQHTREIIMILISTIIPNVWTPKPIKIK